MVKLLLCNPREQCLSHKNNLFNYLNVRLHTLTLLKPCISGSHFYYDIFESLSIKLLSVETLIFSMGM